MIRRTPVFRHKIKAFCLFLVVLLLLPACASRELRGVPTINSSSEVDFSPIYTSSTRSASIKVMTLNIAHARGDGLHQIFQKSHETKQHLDKIGELIKEQRPDIVALQEADGPSFWSGNFNHVKHLARSGSFAQYVRGDHVRGMKLSYGTALLSNIPLWNPLSVTFDPSLSLTPKGFLVSTFRWTGTQIIEVDVVSVHLDMLSKSGRRKQADELIRTLRERNRPMIIMGDFNSDWKKQDSALQLITKELGLKVFRPDSQGMETFPLFKKRLDWIIISPLFKFLTYEILSDVVSDHFGISAVLEIAYEQ